MFPLGFSLFKVIKWTFLAILLWTFFPSFFYEIIYIAGRGSLYLAKIVLNVLTKLVEYFL